MVILFDLRKPGQNFQGSIVYGWLLQLSIYSLCTQQSILRTTGKDRIPPEVEAIVSPQVDATQRGVVFLSRMAAAVWGITHHQDPSVYSLSSLAKPSVSSLSSSVSSPPCPHSPLPEPRISGCKWRLVHWLFKRLFVSPAVSLWQRATLLLFATGCYLCTFQALLR